MHQVQALTLTRLNASLRPFAAADYAALARIHNSNYPDFSLAADEWRFDDQHRPEYCQAGRWVAEWQGRVVGFTHYDQHPSIFHPRKFQLDVAVDPEFHGRGIGRQLYDLVLREVRGLDPLSVDAWSREDMAWRVGFFARRGFLEDMRLWTSALDLTTFDASRFTAVAAQLEAQGLQIRTLAELGGPSDRDVVHRLFELWRLIRQDVPHPPNDALVDVPFELYLERYARPHLLPAGFFVAIDGEQYVGMSELELSLRPEALRTGLTGVRREYRRRGIAVALKTRSFEFAQARGYKSVVTENELHNRGMLAINDAFGFVRNPAWVHYLKAFEA